MIIKGDKIKLVHKIGNFDKVGDIFEVVGVDNGVISFMCNYGTGCMSYDEFEKYFEKCFEKKKRTWTDWNTECEKVINPFSGCYMRFPVSFRNNGKKIQVKWSTYKAEASCCKEDIFDYNKGYELAKRRLFSKIISGQVEKYAKSL